MKLPRTFLVWLLLSTLLVGAAFSQGPAPAPARQSLAPAPRKLLIVAPNTFHVALREFAVHKSLIFPTQLFSLEEILRANSGADDPEKLKRFLYGQWRDQNVGYALLVGEELPKFG